MEGKKTRGKQHIEIKKIQNEKDRQVAFSKRKNGIYKKASELVTLCDIEVGVLLLSPGGKPFTFANPSLESIADRFVNGNPSPESTNISSLLEARRKHKLVELNEIYNSLSSEINAKKSEGTSEEFEKEKNEKEEWWNTTENEPSHEEMKRKEISFFKLRRTLYNELKEKMIEASCSMRD